MLLPTFNTWAEHSKSISSNFNMPLNEWPNIFPDNISPNDMKQMILDEQDMIIMYYAPIIKEIQFLHHVTKIGGSKFRNDPEYYVALQGFDNKAQPVILDIQSMTAELSLRTPKSEDILNLSSTDDVRLARPITGQVKFTTRPVVLIPPSLFTITNKLSSTKPEEIFTAFKAKILDDDTTQHSSSSVESSDNESDHLTEVTRNTIHLSSLFRWLWSATHDRIPHVNIVIPHQQMKHIHMWAARLHQLHITSNTTTANEPPSQLMKNLSSSVEALSQATQLSLAHSTKSNSSKHSFDKLPNPIQQMILFGGSTDNTSSLTQPPKRFRDLLSCRNSTAAKQYLSHILQAEFRCMAIVPQSLAMAIYQGCLLWDNRSLPSNFSIFYCGEPSATNSDNSSKTLMYNLKISEGKGLTETDFKDAIKCSYHFPTNAHELQTQIQNFIGLLGIIFGTDSLLVSQVSTWDSHIQDNFIMYKMNGETSRNFYTQILYGIDISVQNFMRSCKDSDRITDVNRLFLDWTRDHQDIINGRFYFKTPQLRDPTSDTQQPRRQRQRLNNDDDTTVTNHDILPSCKLLPNEEYHTTFLKNGITQPKQDGKPICLNYHIRGSCTKHCRRSHKKLTTESTKTLIAFYEQCRSQKK